MRELPRYGTWIRPRKVALLWAMTVAAFALTSLCVVSPLFLLALVPALPLLWTAVIVSWTSRHLSSRGGGYQDKVHELILGYRGGTGDTLDIGCGSGHLVIAAARRDKASHHVGLDDWGDDWQYSVAQCEANARLEGAANVRFVKASAVATGLESNRYRHVLSCLTFHEVRGLADRTTVVREALRLLEPGGTYVFLDLFDDRRFYPRPELLAAAIEESGCTLETSGPLGTLMRLPYPLGGRKALGLARVVSGRKSSVSVPPARA